MTDRLALRRELLDIIETHKEGFGSGTPESQRIDALIDELALLTPYPHAIDHPEIYQGHWVAVYHNIGKLVGGAAAQNQGVGVTASLKVFSMGRLPDIPAQFLGNGLEIDPASGAYNFVAQFALGERKIPAHHFSLAAYRRRDENLDRFFVDFGGFTVVPADPAMSMAEFAAAIGVSTTLSASRRRNVSTTSPLVTRRSGPRAPKVSSIADTVCQSSAANSPMADCSTNWSSV